MGSGYVICDYGLVKLQFPEFAAIMQNLETQLVNKSTLDWSPLPFGGTQPASNNFGESTLLPPLFTDLNGVQLVTWNQWLNATGSHTLMTGADASGRIFRDYKVGLAGIAFLDKVLRISEIRMQIGDIQLPRINIEEAKGYHNPTFVFEDGYLIDEQTTFNLTGFIESMGPQKIKLIGLETNRVTDKVLTNPGSALS
jgi:hypothetical protein